MAYSAPPDNPYDPSTIDYETQDLPQDEIIRQAFLAQMLNVRVMLPCIVVKVSGEQTVDLQPLLQTRYKSAAGASDLPVLHQVPVSMPMGNDWYIKVPVAVGDTGYAVFADRSLDVWLASSGSATVDPQDTRQHAISDAVFVPGLVPTSKQTTDGTTDLVLKNGKGLLRVKKSGMFDLTNGTNELIDLLIQVGQQLKLLGNTLGEDTTNTIFGPTPLNSFTEYTQIADNVDQLLTKIQTLKG